MLEEINDALREKGSVTLMMKARPGASKTAITGRMDDGTIKIDVAAPSEDGKANEALIRFLADQLDIPRQNLTILSGANSRKKLVRINELTN